MNVNSDKNKALLWQVLLNTGFFDSLEDSDHSLIKKALDGYACSERLNGLSLLAANKCIIDDMHAFILQLNESRSNSAVKDPPAKNYQRSSTI